MDNITYDVDSVKMDELILNINNDIDSINTILNDIKMEFYDMKEYFKGDVADSIQEKWEYYNKEMTTVKENLKTYSEDMLSIKTNYYTVDHNAAVEIEGYTEDREKQIKEKEADNEQVIKTNKLSNVDVNYEIGAGDFNKKNNSAI